MNDHEPNRPDVSEQNVERLLAAYKPEAPDPAYIERVTEGLLAAAAKHAEVRAPERLLRLRRRFGWAFAVAAAVTGVALVLHALNQPPGARQPEAVQDRPRLAEARDFVQADSVKGLTPRPRPAAREMNALALGQSAETKAGERRRVALPDGSVLYVNQNTTVKLDDSRRV